MPHANAVSLHPKDDITVIPEFYPRHKPDWLTAFQYREAIQAGAQFPPPLVARDGKGGPWVLLDGNHTRLALIQLKRDKIDCEVSRAPKAQWLELSIRRNMHGRSLSVQDRARAADMLRRAGYSLKRIEGVMYVPVESVKRLLSFAVPRTPTATAPPGFKSIIAKSAARSAVGGALTPEEIEAAQESLSGASQEAILEQALALFESGLLDRENERVMERAKRLKEVMARWG